MTSSDTLDATPLDPGPLDTDEAVLACARDFVQQAFRRQLWLFLIDETDRLMSVLPRIDIPRKPDADATELLADRLCFIAKEVGAVELAVVYERPGPERLTAADREWLRLLAAADAQHGIPLRGPLLAHGRGVRWIAAEDLDDPEPDTPDRSGPDRALAAE